MEADRKLIALLQEQQEQLHRASLSARSLMQDAVVARQQAEESMIALRASEERFRAAFDGSMIAMSLTRPTGKMVQVNAAFCQMTGYSEAELLARTFYDFTFPEDFDVNRDGIKHMVDGTQDAFPHGKTVHSEGRPISSGAT